MIDGRFRRAPVRVSVGGTTRRGNPPGLTSAATGGAASDVLKTPIEAPLCVPPRPLRCEAARTGRGRGPTAAFPERTGAPVSGTPRATRTGRIPDDGQG